MSAHRFVVVAVHRQGRGAVLETAFADDLQRTIPRPVGQLEQALVDLPE
jgi:hypothetical protein